LLANVPLLILSGTLFKEHLSQHLLLLLIGVIILNVVIARSIEHRIVVVIAIRVPVPNLLIYGLSRWLILCWILRGREDRSPILVLNL